MRRDGARVNVEEARTHGTTEWRSLAVMAADRLMGELFCNPGLGNPPSPSAPTHVESDIEHPASGPAKPQHISDSMERR